MSGWFGLVWFGLFTYSLALETAGPFAAIAYAAPSYCAFNATFPALSAITSTNAKMRTLRNAPVFFSLAPYVRRRCNFVIDAAVRASGL